MNCVRCNKPMEWRGDEIGWIHSDGVARCEGTHVGPVPPGMEGAYNILWNELPLCGCGDPESIVSLFHEVLKLAPFYENRAKLGELLPDDMMRNLVLYSLDRADLIEHGTIITGAWLTDKGEKFLEQLNTYTFEQICEPGFLDYDKIRAGVE